MRKLTPTLALAAVLVALPACSTVQLAYDAVTQPVSMDKVRKSALSVEALFQGALIAANTYAEQPKCGPAAPPAPLCADPATVAKMATLATEADVAVREMTTTVQQIGVEATVADAAVKAASKAVDLLRFYKGGSL